MPIFRGVSWPVVGARGALQPAALETEMYLYDEAELNRRARTEFRLPTHFHADLVALQREAARARGEALVAGLRAIGRMIAKLAAPLVRWRSYRVALAELNALDDRTLADIGIVRADIARVAAGMVMRDASVRATRPVAAPANVNVRKIAA